MPKSPAPKKTVETLRHDDKRRNIPTAEYESLVEKGTEAEKKLRYPRNTDLDPQLVWRGKDEQDWSELILDAPPLYIQEKVHPKVLIDDLRRLSEEGRKKEEAQIDLFSDFNGIPEGIDKTDFYQHDQNWSNRMILGDLLQMMASLAEREGLRGFGRWAFAEFSDMYEIEADFKTKVEERFGEMIAKAVGEKV